MLAEEDGGVHHRPHCRSKHGHTMNFKDLIWILLYYDFFNAKWCSVDLSVWWMRACDPNLIFQLN